MNSNSHNSPTYGPHNPHPLSRLQTELVWEGKYDEYGERRPVDSTSLGMPMQRIETIDEPRARAEAQGDLFDSQKAHLDDFRNLLIWGDNQLVAASLLAEFKGQVKLIYIDPPFDIGADFTLTVGLGDGKAKVSKDQSTMEMVAYRDTWGRGADSYLHMLYERLVLMRDLLSERGTIYVHVGRFVSHLVKLVCDDVFGRGRFINEVTWKRSHAHGDTGQGAKHFGRVTESLLIYAKSEAFDWNPQYLPYPQEVLDRDYKYVDDETGERYRLMPVDGPGGAAKGNPHYEFLGVSGYWRYSKETMQRLYDEGEILLSSTGKSLSRKRYLKDAAGTPVTDLWDDVNRISPTSNERIGYETQKPESLIQRVIRTSSSEGDLIADFFCGSGTTGAVAEKLGRRWLMADLGRFAIHTSRKRLIEVQRELHAAGSPYRAFEVLNLGRYERQWWQRELLTGADEEHRRVVLEFFRAELLENPPAPLLHGRKGPAFCHVDAIDSIFTRVEAESVAKAASSAGGQRVYCLSWEFEMDLRIECDRLEKELEIEIKLIQIPREIMEKNRTEPPPFLEVATLDAVPVFTDESDGSKSVDIQLTSFLPSLSEVPSREVEALRERAVRSGFDFIDFWAVDFDYKVGEPFHHDWQDYRLRKDRSLKTTSSQHYIYEAPGTYTACVKVVDVFGADTSITIEVPYG